MAGSLQLSVLLVCLGALAFASVVPAPFQSFSTKAINLHFAGNESLDGDGKFKLTWSISEDGNSIEFDISAETLGYVGFGFSPSGGMAGADIFIAGVDSSGKNYSGDYHSEKNGPPDLDEQQDYELIDASETETHTNLKFRRQLITCDEHDFPITDETMKLIWSMGKSDDLEHHTTRGTKTVNFYLADEEFDEKQFKKFELTNEREMDAQHTTYWCTIHQMPVFNETQHIVAFEPVLENPDALNHTHHFILYRCHAPEGEDPVKFFEPWINPEHPGDYCYEQKNQEFPFSQYCNGNQVYVWSKGGKRMVLPSDMGLPMPDVPGTGEFFAMEVHYDNPTLAQKTFSTGARMYYTDKLRKTEVGLMVVDQRTKQTLTIPPQASDFIVAGHCSPECTKELIPEKGITAFNNLLHAHLAGRKIKLRHFRDGKELEWLDNDNYYDFDFQQNKPLRTPRQIMKGDQLTVECTYDSMKVKDGKAVIGGLSSSEEMCQAWFFYHPRMDGFSRCGSSQAMDEHMKLLGITNYTEATGEIDGGTKRIEVLEPEHLKGNYLDVISTKVTWDEAFRKKFQEEKRYGAQQPNCKGAVEGRTYKEIKYPDVEDYKPEDICQRKGDDDTGAGSMIKSTFGLVVILFVIRNIV